MARLRTEAEALKAVGLRRESPRAPHGYAQPRPVLLRRDDRRLPLGHCEVTHTPSWGVTATPSTARRGRRPAPPFARKRYRAVAATQTTDADELRACRQTDRLTLASVSNCESSATRHYLPFWAARSSLGGVGRWIARAQKRGGGGGSSPSSDRHDRRAVEARRAWAAPAARRPCVVSRQRDQSGGGDHGVQVRDRVQVESESTERPPRAGVVEEVVQRARLTLAIGSAGTTGTRASIRRRRAAVDREGVGPKTQGAGRIPVKARARSRGDTDEAQWQAVPARTLSPGLRRSDATTTAGSPSTAPAHVLVVAHRTAATLRLLDEVRALAGCSPCKASPF